MRVTIKPRIHAAIFLLLIGLTMSGTAYSQVPVWERDALIALYTSTNGVNWTAKTGWLGEAGTECDWHGVTCSSEVVTRLFFYNNSLTGTIPSELGNLTNLTFLQLGSNSLTGSIPAELGNLTKLTYLYLGDNSLTGSIPSELANLADLSTLHLGHNELSGGIPPTLGNLVNLTRIYLNNNSLNGRIPATLGSLSNLTYLSLSENLLSGPIPSELGNLTDLIHLTLNNNFFSGGFPPEVENLTHLTKLDVSNNAFSSSKPIWLDNSTIENLDFLNSFPRDSDMDGIDDEIDSDTNYASPIMLVTDQADYSISILGSGRVVNFVSPSRFEKVITKPPMYYKDKHSLTNILYSYFFDEFDFMGYALNLDEPPKGAPYTAFFSDVGNSVKGNNARIFDDSNTWGSDGKLTGFIEFLQRDGIAHSGLHEIAHDWGNRSALPSSDCASCAPHWGYRNIGGQLGGWLPGSLENMGDDMYRARSPLTGEFGLWFPTGNRYINYSNFELYLMGLIDVASIGHDIKTAEGFEWIDIAAGIFKASEITTMSMQQFVAAHGERVPNYLNSQKSFRGMYIVLSDRPLTLEEWRLADRAVYDMQLPSDNGNKYDNFWEATQGKATISFDQLGSFSKNNLVFYESTNPAVTSPLTKNKPTFTISDDKEIFIVDTDGAAGESVQIAMVGGSGKWLVNGVEVATGLTATLALPNGSTVVAFKAVDNDGTSSTTTATITITAPAYEPTEEWPSPYNGVTPDSSFGLAFNNIGVFSASDSIIYTCLRVFTDGLPGSVGGSSEFDIGLKVVSLSEATVQITKFREFNAIGALNENAQTPDCSGKFETTTGIYTDIIVAGDSVLDTTWNLIDPTNLILKLDSFKELTAN